MHGSGVVKLKIAVPLIAKNPHLDSCARPGLTAEVKDDMSKVGLLNTSEIVSLVSDQHGSCDLDLLRMSDMLYNVKLLGGVINPDEALRLAQLACDFGHQP